MGSPTHKPLKTRYQLRGQPKSTLLVKFGLRPTTGLQCTNTQRRNERMGFFTVKWTFLAE
eukprot:m.216792 g.216792  ORF g.216792 m.216792 type:complete len:60 (-) comp15549_c0_seq4:4985-5164(-)